MVELKMGQLVKRLLVYSRIPTHSQNIQAITTAQSRINFHALPQKLSYAHEIAEKEALFLPSLIHVHKAQNYIKNLTRKLSFFIIKVKNERNKQKEQK